MPLKRCKKNGWKWGDNGHCYTGKDAKKMAIKQGIAIEGPENFVKITKAEVKLEELADIIILSESFSFTDTLSILFDKGV